jgi:hypothetical protein
MILREARAQDTAPDDLRMAKPAQPFISITSFIFHYSRCTMPRYSFLTATITRIEIEAATEAEARAINLRLLDEISARPMDWSDYCIITTPCDDDLGARIPSELDAIDDVPVPDLADCLDVVA